MPQPKDKKLALVFTTSLSITLASIKAISTVVSYFAFLTLYINTLPLEHMLYIHYLIQF